MNLDARQAPIFNTLIAIALVGFVLVLIHWAAPVLNPVLLAMYLAALAAPLYRWMQQRSWNSGVSLLMLVVVIALVFGGLGLLLWLSANRLLAGLATYGDQLAAQLDALPVSGVPIDGASLTKADTAMNAALLYFVGAIAEIAGMLIFSVIVVALLLLEVPRFEKMLRTDLKDRPLFAVLPQLANTAIAYFLIRTRLNVFTGLGVFVMLLVLGVDYAPLWGVLVFALSYIPYIGLFVASVPPVILAFAEHGPIRALLVILGVAIVNVTIENVVAPVYTGRGLNLSPLIVFIAFFFWAWLLGPVGALLSMPITVLILLLLQQDERTQWLARIIGTSETAAEEGTPNGNAG